MHRTTYPLRKTKPLNLKAFFNRCGGIVAEARTRGDGDARPFVKACDRTAGRLQNLKPRAQPRERDVHNLLGQIVTGFVLQDSSSVLAAMRKRAAMSKW